MPIKLRDRDPILMCWRVAAIYRCVLRYKKPREWALEKLREIAPDGSRDQMLDIWYLGIERLWDKTSQRPDLPVRQLYQDEISDAPDFRDAMAAA